MADNEAQRRALGLAVTILQDLPKERRPESDIHDMQTIIAGKSTGRGSSPDNMLIIEALTTALAFRIISRRPEAKPTNQRFAGLNNRVQELKELLELLAKCDAWTAAVSLELACDRLQHLGEEATL